MKVLMAIKMKINRVRIRMLRWKWMDRLPRFIIDWLRNWAWVDEGNWDLEDGTTWSSSSEYTIKVGDDVDLVMEWGTKVAEIVDLMRQQREAQESSLGEEE